MMPLVRYFLFTGGILLGLLLFTDWYFPKPISEAAAADVDRSIIRIHSGHRWPDAIRLDTSAPMPPVTPLTATASRTPASVPAVPVREAFAYARPAPSKLSDKPKRRAKPVSRLSAREPHRRLAYQSNWFSEAW
jgi:hypothetical protein